MNEKRRRANALMMKYYSGMIDEGSWKTAAGDIAVFSTKYRRNLKSLIVQLKPVQAGSGDPSPDNIRPISGRTGATVTRTGKNLFDASQLLQASGWSVDANGVYSGARGSFHVAFSNGFPIVPKFKENTRYTLSLTARSSDESSYSRVGFMYTDGTSTSVANITTTAETQYNGVSAAGKTVSGIYGTYGSGPSVTLYLTNIQLEESTTVTPYVPYTGTTIPVSWETEAGTVYGGELDVVSGVLTVDKVINADLGNASGWFASGKNFVLPISEKAIAVVGSQNIICSKYKTMPASSSVSGHNSDNNLVYEYVNQNWVVFRDTAYSDLNNFKSSLTGVQLVYKIAEPITYQLTPQQIQTLIGENVIWSDAGVVSVEYWS